ncbi:hypothetical protein HMPREF1544_00161 [Mucor circinelloides 1006PhL]|uniref:VASt domain-containing protein n=1 Tax=Mucor circinelloides f. circinelloides (strain 1006PhL) TaxID=1220926 RepID=S2JX80_MUCC1|nr:hypothetical protein HMPREF1544_00161 [Mucor circinelloides 1006PhL]
MSTDSLTVNTASTKRGRPHSNTISGGRPPALDIAISRPTNVRRNSEGSPGLPPPICISEPTPIEPSKDHANGFFNDTSKPASRPVTPDTDSVVSNASSSVAPAPLPKASATAPVGTTNLLESPTQKKKSRSRASSVTSNLINEIKESSTIQSLASKIKSRHSSEDAEVSAAPAERNSSDNQSTIAQSVAGTSGVYVANAKRNQDFHALFRSVPEEDNLIEDFGCALQKEILLQGRIYISESYLCFNANIFGWVTNLVIAFADIVEIEKKATAYFIPNAIQISTDSAKHFFASFLSRDQAYDLMVDIWRIARPDLVPPKEGEGSAQGVNDFSSSPSSLSSSSVEEDESDSDYDSDTEDSYSDDTGSEDLDVTDTNATVTQGAAKDGNRPRKVSMASMPNNKDTAKMDSAARRRAMSEAPRPNFQSNEEEKSSKAAATANGTVAANRKSTKSSDPAANAASATNTTKEGDAKPQVHDKTDCECSTNNEHYPNVVMDQVYNSTLEKIYNIIFDSEFMKKFLVDNQKSTELEMGEWKKGEGNVEYVRELSYIKPLGGAIGPKQTKCYITQEVLHQDIQKYVTVLTTTSTPDVPSGSSFSCKTRTCFTWAGKGKVRVLVTVQVEFTKSSWLKSTIEKASIDGQQTYYQELDAAIRQYAKEHPSEFADNKSKREGGSKSKRRKARKHKSAHTPKPEETEKKQEKPKSAVHQVLGSMSNLLADGITSVIDIVSSPRAAHLTLICLVIMVGINIFIARKMAFVEQQLSELSHAFPNSAVDENEPTTVDISFLPGTQRRQYNRQEEQDLWDWLGRIDPDKSNEKREKIAIPLVKDPKEQEAIFDDAIQISKLAKERLDKHMAELSNMIQKAESNLQDVTKSVNDQRQKIKQQDQQ